MRTTASVSRTHARDGVSRDHHRMCSRQFTGAGRALTRVRGRSEGAARRRARSRSRGTCCGARPPSRPPSPSTSPSSLPPSTCRRHAGLPAPAPCRHSPLPPASRAPPLARRPGPELELRFSRRRGGAQRSNCSQRHSFRHAWGRGAAAAAPAASPALPPRPPHTSAAGVRARAQAQALPQPQARRLGERQLHAATGKLEAGGAAPGAGHGAAGRLRARRRGGAPERGALCGGGRASVIALAHINTINSPRPRTRRALALAAPSHSPRF